ncbi:MAG: hypothetical protein ACLUOO_02810 [Coprococcus sp.]
MGDMLTKGLAGGIEDSAGAAISAAEDLNNGILGVMNGLAADMQSAVPSNFAFDTSRDGGFRGRRHGRNGRHLFRNPHHHSADDRPQRGRYPQDLPGALQPDPDRFPRPRKI